MVCSKCEKKLSRGIHQEMWKEGSRQTIESGGRKINQNMALSGKKRWTPYGGATGGSKCKICKQSMHQAGIYCQKCAYHKGMCSMCGVKVMDTTFYNMGGESAAAQAARRSDEAILAAKDDDDGDEKDGNPFGFLVLYGVSAVPIFITIAALSITVSYTHLTLPTNREV